MSGPFVFPLNFQTLFEKAPGLFLVLDPRFNIIAVSDAYNKATMTKREDILGRNIFEVFPDNPIYPGASGLKNLMASPTLALLYKKRDPMAVQKYDIQVSTGKFEERFWSPLNEPIINAKGEVQYIIHRVEDVTEFVHLKQQEKEQHEKTEILKVRAELMETEIFNRNRDLQNANEQLRLSENLRQESETALLKSYQVLEKRVEERTADLEAALKTRDEFLLIASHELKTPLTSLKLRLQLAKRNARPESLKTFTNSELTKIFTQALEQTDSLANLVEDLLDVSRIQIGKFNLNLHEIDFSTMVKNVIGRFKEQFEEANCRMEMIIKDGIFTLCDQLRMEQVMTNLITNAIKYGAGSLIQFHLDLIDDNQTIFLSVKDGGVGIPKDKQEKIFERFERLTSYKHIGGLGLGLFIVKKIVSSHQGEVYVESEPGKGATFIVKLPLLKTS